MTVKKAAPPRKRAPRKAPQDRKRREPKLIRLDIACGDRKGGDGPLHEEGWVGIDLAGEADIHHDLLDFPWPIKSGTVEAARCVHFVEHIPHWQPGWARDGWWLFFEECHRVLADEAQMMVQVPYSRSDRAWWDPTHVRAIHEQTWYYLDAEWRKSQKLDHYDTSVDFEVVTIEGLGISDDVLARPDDWVQFAREHYYNIVHDLRVILKRR